MYPRYLGYFQNTVHDEINYLLFIISQLPEMNEQAREAERESGSVCLVYVLQNLGLLAGWGIILLLVLYKDDISL